MINLIIFMVLLTLLLTKFSISKKLYKEINGYEIKVKLKINH